MSYSTLGTNCMSQTIAFTSNEHFLSPINSIYFQTFIRPNYPSEGQKIKNLSDTDDDKKKTEKFEDFKEKNSYVDCKSCKGS